MESIDRLVEILGRLRDPEQGCPWDREQSFETIAPYTIEEAYEVEDAIHRGDMQALRDELGDLLLQVVYHARLAEEAGHFRLADVAAGLCEKLVRRHPHVFGDRAEVANRGEAQGRWAEIKAAERRERSAARGGWTSALDEVPLGLPALARAAKLQRRAARAGFEDLLPQPTAQPPLAPTELGERLFEVVARANRLGLDAEEALRSATRRFEADVRARERRERSGS